MSLSGGGQGQGRPQKGAPCGGVGAGNARAACKFQFHRRRRRRRRRLEDNKSSWELDAYRTELADNAALCGQRDPLGKCNGAGPRGRGEKMARKMARGGYFPWLWLAWNGSKSAPPEFPTVECRLSLSPLAAALPFGVRKDFCTPLSRDRVLLNPFSHAPKNREPSIKREPASWRASEVLKHPSIDDTSQISDSPQNAHSLSWRFRYNCPCSLVLVLAPYFAFCTFFASR